MGEFVIKGIEGAEVRDLGGACKVTIGEREAGVSDVIVENLIEEIAITADILATDEPRRERWQWHAWAKHNFSVEYKPTRRKRDR